MEIKASTVTAFVAICMLIVQALAQPMLGDEVDGDLSAEKRPKYLDTRTLSGFKNALLMALDELINEDKVSPSILNLPEISEKPKRGRYMTICVQRSSSGALVPTPCWRAGKDRGRR